MGQLNSTDAKEQTARAKAEKERKFAYFQRNECNNNIRLAIRNGKHETSCYLVKSLLKEYQNKGFSTQHVSTFGWLVETENYDDRINFWQAGNLYRVKWQK